MVALAQPRFDIKFDRANKKIIVNVTQDVEPYLKEAKRFRDAQPRTLDRKRWAEREFTIPNVLIEKFFNEGLNYYDKNDRKKIRKIILTDPAYRYLRTGRARPLSRRPVPAWAEKGAAWEAVGILRAVSDQAKLATVAAVAPSIILPSTGR